MSARLRLAMTRLADAGLSIRQIARATGVSLTRIHQLLQADEARAIPVWLSHLQDQRLASAVQPEGVPPALSSPGWGHLADECAVATQTTIRCKAKFPACRIHCLRAKENMMPSKQPSGNALGVRPYVSQTGAFTSGSDSPRAFLERCLEVIAAQEDAVGAFVTLNIVGARAAADASTARWKAGATLSPIDGMPVGIKDIMETADMATEQGSPLFVGWHGKRDCAAVAALREAGAVVLGKTVTTEFAASHPARTRNPWDPTRTPGGSSSGSAAAVGSGMIPAALGSQVIGSIIRPASFCGCVGFKPSVGGINRGGSFDHFSQSCTGVLGATLADTWTVARAIALRAGGDPGYPGLSGPIELPAARQPRRIALLETAGWPEVSAAAKQAFAEARQRLQAAGIEVIDRTSHDAIAALETAIAEARPLSMAINAWEGRWPLNTYASDMDRNGLSSSAQDRLAEAQNMSQVQYQGLLSERQRIREVYAALLTVCDACMTLAAPGAAPIGLDWTGNPVFTVPTSLLGVPSLSLPVFEDDGLPLGLQLVGFADRDADVFSVASAIMALFAD
jgi:Asp-tRNA(Asn)/Glu-tRNA(Gln) amidotransferase A subunit family amidase